MTKMKKISTFLIAFVALLSWPAGLHAADHFFSVDGAGTKDGSSWENANKAANFETVVEGLASGDNVYLMAGTYTITPTKVDGEAAATVTIPQGVTIKGGYPTTMTGTATAITYPTASPTIFQGETLAAAFLSVKDGSGGYEGKELTKLAGIVFTGYTGNASSNYQGVVMYIQRVNMELDHCYFYSNKNNKSGGIIASNSARLYAHDCVWRDNVAAGVGVALRTSAWGGAPSLTILDRCEFSNNTVIKQTSANYGGTLAVADANTANVGQDKLYLNNCTATGTHINRCGAFVRMGGNTVLYATNNTLYDFTCCAANTNGSSYISGMAISLGSSAKGYFANNIIVNKTDAANTDTENNKRLALIYAQDANGVIATKGYNYVGSIMQANTTLTYDDTDNVTTANLVSTAFGSNTLTADAETGTKIIEPVINTNPTLTALQTIATQWGLDAVGVDVTLDQRGYLRPERTVTGAYDKNAVAQVALYETTDNMVPVRANADVALSRTVAAGEWNTICLPFALSAAEIAAAFGNGTEVAEFKEMAGTNYSFKSVAEMEAGVAYLIKPTTEAPADGYAFSGKQLVSDAVANSYFTGSFSTQQVAVGDVIVAANNKMKTVGTAGKIKAFRAYFPAQTGGEAKSYTFSIDDQPTGIIGIDGDIIETTDNIYDLQGRKVSKPQHGVYIMGGKKVVVK